MTDKLLPWADVSLKPLDAISASTFKDWQNDPEVRNRTMGFRFPVQSFNVSHWQEQKAQENGGKSVSFSIFFRDVGVGAIFLTKIDWVHRTTDLGIYIGANEARGKGIGYCACALILDYAFNGLNLRRVALQVAQTNKRACSLYESLGFCVEGIDRDAYLLRGLPTNVMRFGILANEFDVPISSKSNRVT